MEEGMVVMEVVRTCALAECRATWVRADFQNSKAFCSREHKNQGINRRLYKPRPPRSGTCARRECGAPWAGGPWNKIFCSVECSDRACRQRPSAMARARIHRMRRANAANGRRCKWCGCTDVDTRFPSEAECQRCVRLRHRQACKRCGGPAYKRSGCLVGRDLPLGFDCRDEA